MCTNPLHLQRPNLGFSFDVPCNSCLECQSASQDSWLFRLSCDLDALYKRKGFGVFLTFTYNDVCLPHSDFGLRGATQSCFNSDDTSRFLNKIKVYMNRTYGNGAYRYFVCSEYGKFTKRPHLHALFMLEKNVDYYNFCEKCRQYWNYGFMFPRQYNGVYYDNNMCRTTPLLHTPQKCCKYVIKYITKDMFFYDLPLIQKYLEVRKDLPSNIRSHYNKFLPHHFQSKGIGSSFFSSCDTPDKLLKCVTDGVVNPSTLKVVQLPRYFVEHFAFNHSVKERCGQKIVVRTLKDDYRCVVRQVLFNSFHSRIQRLDNFFQNINPFILKRYDYKVSDFDLVLRARALSSEQVVLRSFYNNLSPKTRWYFDKFYKLNLSSVVDFKLDLLSLDFSDFPESFNHYDLVDDFMSLFYRVDNTTRSELLSRRYNEYLIQKKLKLLQKNCL